jgi:hypothetical protein
MALGLADHLVMALTLVLQFPAFEPQGILLMEFLWWLLQAEEGG